MRRKMIVIMIAVSLIMTYVLIWDSLAMYLRTAQTKRISEAFQYENEITVQCSMETLEYNAAAFWNAMEACDQYNLFSVVDHCRTGTAAESKTITVMLECNEDIPADIIWNDDAAAARCGVVLGKCNRALTHERNQKTYLYVNGNEYEVIGWFRETAAEQIYLFTEGMTIGDKIGISQELLFTYDRMFCYMTLGSNGTEANIINSMYEYLLEQYLSEAQGDWNFSGGYNDETVVTVMDVFYSAVLGMMAGLFIFCLLNLMLLMNVWMSERAREFVVKLVYGWQTGRIILNAQKELFFMQLVACLIGGMAVCLPERDSMAAIWLNWQYVLLIACILIGSVLLILIAATAVMYVYLRRLQPAVLLGKQQ